MDERFAEVYRDVKVLRVKYERLIQVCEDLITPRAKIAHLDLTDPTAEPGEQITTSIDTPQKIHSQPCAKPSPLCLEVDRLIERARSLTTSDPEASADVHSQTHCHSVKNVKSSYKSSSPSNISSSKNALRTRAVSSSKKSSSMTTDRTPRVKQTPPPSVVLRKCASTEGNGPLKKSSVRIDKKDQLPRSDQRVGNISKVYFPSKYSKVKGSLAALANRLEQNEQDCSRGIETFISKLCAQDELSGQTEALRLIILVNELQVLNNVFNKLLTCDLAITDQSSVTETVRTKLKLDSLLKRHCCMFDNEAVEQHPILTKDSRNETEVHFEDYTEELSLQVQLMFINLCKNHLLPWLYQTSPSDKMYPFLLQTIQVLVGLKRTTFISTVGYQQTT